MPLIETLNAFFCFWSWYLNFVLLREFFFDFVFFCVCVVGFMYFFSLHYLFFSGILFLNYSNIASHILKLLGLQ